MVNSLKITVGFTVEFNSHIGLEWERKQGDKSSSNSNGPVQYFLSLSEESERVRIKGVKKARDDEFKAIAMVAMETSEKTGVLKVWFSQIAREGF